ncbi:hypothetical protein HYX18_00365 [Candidatus Woesearchaeota archaeon]|nr:hypothetical protein [Candidatus Woesearchaeota archaeon]
MKQNAENAIVYSCLAISLIAVISVAYFYISSMMMEDKTEVNTQTQTANTLTRMKFTEFDKSKAIEFMDSNHDGMCDFCGMRIEDCMASGMMQCTMDSEHKIGLLKSAHHHIDIKIYSGGKQINLADSKYFVKSSFVHVENDGPEKTGSVLHVHATGIDLSFFLESLGIKSTNLKVYVNGQLNNRELNYVSKNADRILITDSTNKEDVNNQLRSVTSFSL